MEIKHQCSQIQFKAMRLDPEMWGVVPEEELVGSILAAQGACYLYKYHMISSISGT